MANGQPFGIFGKPLRAGLEQERLASFGQAERAQRGANVLGLRTSGVGRIGAQQVARNRALREAAFRRALGLAEAQQIGTERLQGLSVAVGRGFYGQQELKLADILSKFEEELQGLKTLGAEIDKYLTKGE